MNLPLDRLTPKRNNQIAYSHSERYRRSECYTGGHRRFEQRPQDQDEGACRHTRLPTENSENQR